MTLSSRAVHPRKHFRDHARPPPAPPPTSADAPATRPVPVMGEDEGDGLPLFLRLRIHRGRPHRRPGVDRRRRRVRPRVLRGLHRVRRLPGGALGAAQRAGQAPLAGRPGLALARAHPRRPVRLPAGAGAGPAGRAAGAVGLVRRVRPCRAGPALGRDAGAAPGDPPVHQGAAPALGRPGPSPAAGRRGGPARRARRRPAQPGPVAGDDARGRFDRFRPGHRERHHADRRQECP